VSDLFSHVFSLKGRLALLLVLAFAAPLAVRAAEPPQLAEKTSEELNKLKPLTDEKNWDGALALLDSLQTTVGPTTFDFAVIADIKGKIYMQKGDYAKAIEPFEAAVRLGDAYNYFDERDIAEKVSYLYQLYYQEATSTKSPTLQQQYFTKALDYVTRWSDSHVGRTAPEAQRQEANLLKASMLYNQAIINPDKVDKVLLQKAQVAIENGLLSSPRPKDTFYVLLLATYQQELNYLKAAEILELLVKQFPTKKDYWAQLIATYNNLAINKDEDISRKFNIRAIVTIERAQALGFNRTQKDNFNLVGIYINLGQYGKATELLYAGLKNGSIESTQRNWDYLASSYQQVDKPYQAIDVLKESSRHFPKIGQIDFEIAQIYYRLDKSADAYNYLESAVAKGHLERASSVYNFLAYTAFELRHFDKALEAVNKAIATSDDKHDTQLPRLKQAIEDSIKENAQAAAPAGNAP
jgi:tetratricopeptide (TPR) repeat protein